VRPRSEIGAPRFSCRTRIEQDRQGGVIDIKLDQCNGSQRWQQSLVSAIRTASPLPAPPDASVYADRLWLTFGSEGFQSGGSTQGFEPESREARLADNRSQVLESFEHFASQSNKKLESGAKEDTDVIHLTIVGTPATSPPAPANTTPDPASDTATMPSTAQ